MTDTPALQPSDLILQMLMEKLLTERGIHIETIFTALGALAGFGCQMAIREGLIKTGQVAERVALIEVVTTSDEVYYFGDFLNEPLLSVAPGRISVLGLVLAAAEAAGAKMFPDIEAIVKHAASTCGTPEFFEMNLPKDHQPQMTSLEALQRFWPDCQAVLEQAHTNPVHWGWIIAQAAQTLIVQTKDILEPEMAAKIVMEAAIPMSKMAPAAVLGQDQPPKRRSR
jgi:hypothetical protein